MPPATSAATRTAASSPPRRRLRPGGGPGGTGGAPQPGTAVRRGRPVLRSRCRRGAGGGQVAVPPPSGGCAPGRPGAPVRPDRGRAAARRPAADRRGGPGSPDVRRASAAAPGAARAGWVPVRHVGSLVVGAVGCGAAVRRHRARPSRAPWRTGGADGRRRVAAPSFSVLTALSSSGCTQSQAGTFACSRVRGQLFPSCVRGVSRLPDPGKRSFTSGNPDAYAAGPPSSVRVPGGTITR